MAFNLVGTLPGLSHVSLAPSFLSRVGRGRPLSSVDFWQRGPGAAAPGGVSGVSPEILSPLAPAGSALKKPLFERGADPPEHGKVLVPCKRARSLMLQQIYIRPIPEVQTGIIQAHSMYPRWNNRCHRLVIQRQPAHIANSYLLSLIVQSNSCVTRLLLCLHHRRIKRRVTPRAAIIR